MTEHDNAGKPSKTGRRDEIDQLKSVLRETIANLERVVEEGERALRRAKQQLDRFD